MMSMKTLYAQRKRGKIGRGVTLSNAYNEKQLSKELNKIITLQKRAEVVKPIRTLCLNKRDTKENKYD